MNKIYLRPHHGLCIQHYTGNGYNEGFTKNMNHIIGILTNHPEQEIIITLAPDVLCLCCPNLQDGICESEEKVMGYDQKCLSLSGFHNGQHISWALMKKTMYEKIINHMKLHTVCSGCNWLLLCTSVNIHPFYAQPECQNKMK